MIRKYLLQLIENSFRKNSDNILGFLKEDAQAEFIDLGCDDGEWTMRLAQKIKTKNISGVEIVKARSDLAGAKGIKVFPADLNKPLPLADNFFDVVHCNQVIEHLYDTDNLVSEIYRILKPGGYAVVSTENLASWHNIFALILGFQPFSMTNFSAKGNIGNPFALWKGKKSDNSSLSSWQHVRLFSYYGLKDLCRKFGFRVETVKTAGYYPLPGFFSKLDKIHGHWISLRLIK